MNIVNLFPTPVCSKYLEPLSKLILQKILKHETKPDWQFNVLQSKNKYILEEKFLKNLKKQIDSFIQEYVDEIIKPSKNLKFYITQSWLNYTGEKQIHYPHFHPNSIISGVYYINADPKLDFILFKKNVYDQIKIYPSKFNIHNSDTWWIPAATNKLILFPSSLMHEVGNVKKTYGKRISLAFNVFVKGDLGSKQTLTELRI
jgi:uncharacterized protein (TIGR02466 family)|tara:strand:- start:4589 stop:5194 length:606 start_codon:yes stop_codon:yes gene_type:complete